MKTFWPWTRHELSPQDAVDSTKLLSKLIDRNSRWSEVADAKAGVVLVFTTASVRYLIAEPLQSVGKIARALPQDLSVLTIAFAAAFVICLIVATLGALIAFVESFRTLNPTVTRRQGPGHLFFGDIASYSLEPYQHCVLQLSIEELHRELTEQAHTTGVITAQKHRRVKRAISGVFSMAAFGVGAYLLNLQVL